MNSDTDRMMQMITGYWVTQIVHAAATFSFADHLAKGATRAEDIAKAEGTDPSATFRLLRTCASLGMVTYDGKSRFGATSLLDTLRKDNPKNLRGMALSWPAPVWCAEIPSEITQPKVRAHIRDVTRPTPTLKSPVGWEPGDADRFFEAATG